MEDLRLLNRPIQNRLQGIKTVRKLKDGSYIGSETWNRL
jgi:hypothetical protein